MKNFKIWKLLPKVIQIFLAEKGLIDAELGDDYLVLAAYTRRKMKNMSTASSQIQFIEILITEANHEKDPFKRNTRSLLTRDMASTLAWLSENNANYQKKEQKKIMELFETAKAEYQASALFMQAELDGENIELEEFVVEFPGIYPNWDSSQSLRDFLVVVYQGWPNSVVSYNKKLGDWIDSGETIINLKNEENRSLIKNPVPGIIVSIWHDGADLAPEWKIVPKKGYKLSENIGEFIFGEVIDFAINKLKETDPYEFGMNHVYKRRGELGKVVPIEKLKEMILKGIEELKNIEPEMKEMDEETRAVVKKARRNLAKKKYGQLETK